MNVSRLAGRAAGALCAAAAGLVVSTAQAQDIRMYAFSSGALTLGKGILQNSRADGSAHPVAGRLLS